MLSAPSKNFRSCSHQVFTRYFPEALYFFNASSGIFTESVYSRNEIFGKCLSDVVANVNLESGDLSEILAVFTTLLYAHSLNACSGEPLSTHWPIGPNLPKPY